MATGAKMSFNPYQNGKFNTMSQNSQGIEVSQDMHLKMSKKIAQLTKVFMVRVRRRWLAHFLFSHTHSESDFKFC